MTVREGDAVYARVDKDRIGTFAEFAAVREGAAALKPTNLTFEQAASLPLVARLGADVAIDHRRSRFEDVAKECDVVLDSAGGDTLVRSFQCVKPGGVVVSIGGTPSVAFARRWGLVERDVRHRYAMPR
ncbi:MAG TPA: zinc-binding dehydrogenase [Gemmatimonadaceae bacterium]